MNESTSLPTDSEFLRSYQRHVDEQKQRAAAAVQQLTVTLTALGVTTVVAEYDGCGDSGQIDSIGFRNEAGEDCTEVPDAVESQVEDLLYDLLGVRHGGWENNDGAFGTFCWKLSEQTLEHEHNERYTEYEISTHEGFDDLNDSEIGS